MIVEIQRIAQGVYTPDDESIRRWVLACPGVSSFDNIAVRIVEPGESRQLNARYRGKDASTNVLSFPGIDDSLPAELNTALGDLVICAEVVNAEAARFTMPREHRWMHIVVHGVLHLLGYDHADEQGRESMEAEERRILTDFGLADPYTIE